MIILQFDHTYYRWGSLMLRSLALHEPKQRLLADTVNLLPEQVTQLRQVYPGLIVQNDSTGANPTAVQMANRKALVMQNALAAYPDEPWYGLFDADFLVRRPLTSLWSLLDEHQAALLLTNGLWDGQVYPRLITVSSIVLVRSDGRPLVDNWAKWYWYDRPIGTIQPRQWFWDQVTLLLAWCETPISHANIPIHIFADASLSDQAAVWSANVTDKQYYYNLFQQEYERQRYTE